MKGYLVPFIVSLIILAIIFFAYVRPLWSMEILERKSYTEELLFDIEAYSLDHQEGVLL